MSCDDSYTKVLLHFNKIFLGFEDAASCALSNAQYMSGGTSLYMYNAVNYAVNEYTTRYSTGTADTTYETYVRFISVATYEPLIFLTDSGTYPSTSLYIYYYNGNLNIKVSSTNYAFAWSPYVDIWYHVAVVRASNVVRCYIDGKQIGSATAFSHNISGTNRLIIGSAPWPHYHSLYGYLDEMRISSTARYTARFTPKGTGFQMDANTLFLSHFNGVSGTQCVLNEYIPTAATRTYAMFDESGKQWLTQSGMMIDPTVGKFGPSLLTYETYPTWPRVIYTADHSDFYINTDDFCFDFWIRLAALPANGEARYVFSQTYSTKRFQFYIRNDSGNYYWGLYAKDTSISQDVSLEFAWAGAEVDVFHHIAILRNTGNTMCFVDGTQIGVTKTTSYVVPNVNGVFYIGWYSSLSNNIVGRIDEFRFSRGTSRWSADFTPYAVAYGPVEIPLLDGADAPHRVTPTVQTPITAAGADTPIITGVEITAALSAALDGADSKVDPTMRFSASPGAIDGSEATPNLHAGLVAHSPAMTGEDTFTIPTIGIEAYLPHITANDTIILPYISSKIDRRFREKVNLV